MNILNNVFVRFVLIRVRSNVGRVKILATIVHNI